MAQRLRVIWAQGWLSVGERIALSTLAHGECRQIVIMINAARNHPPKPIASGNAGSVIGTLQSYAEPTRVRGESAREQKTARNSESC